MKHSLLFFLCLWRMIDLYSQCSLTSELNKFRVNDTIVKQQIRQRCTLGFRKIISDKQEVYAHLFRPKRG